ncbi:hypothetical protein ENBRE01_0514 [Enteropsectra breve]|nr:hypothetical protein ENBRE01_0514 [Enteropsectra breve]
MVRRVKITSNEDLQSVINLLEAEEYPLGFSKDQKRSLRRRADNFCLINGQLCFKSSENINKRAVFDFQTELLAMILREEHSNGHIGMKKLVDLINSKYYGISSDVICNYVRACPSCQRYNSLSTLFRRCNNKYHKKIRSIYDGLCGFT